MSVTAMDARDTSISTASHTSQLLLHLRNSDGEKKQKEVLAPLTSCDSLTKTNVTEMYQDVLIALLGVTSWC